MSDPYRVLMVHTAYQQRGGEDTVVEAEVELLKRCGHEVSTYFRDNHELENVSIFGAVGKTLWSKEAARDLRDEIKRTRPDIIHVHNTFPLISPSIYWAASDAKVPLVQTLHNFRLACLNAMFLRDGKVCEDCIGHIPWRGVLHKCYRGSAAASGVLAGMLTMHRAIGTYATKVSRFVALNEFCRDKFIEAGLPRDKISIKPNFVDWSEPERKARKGLLFVGRLSPEKGIDVLIRAIGQNPSLAPIRIVGGGPDIKKLRTLSFVTALGEQSPADVRREMEGALALVLPSIWYENFPRTIIESFASGLPVIASRIGPLQEIVRDGETGLLFEPGDAADLAEKMLWCMNNSQRMHEMGIRAREQYEREFTPGVNYKQLIAIYQEAMACNANFSRSQS